MREMEQKVWGRRWSSLFSAALFFACSSGRPEPHDGGIQDARTIRGDATPVEDVRVHRVVDVGPIPDGAHDAAGHDEDASPSDTLDSSIVEDVGWLPDARDSAVIEDAASPSDAQDSAVVDDAASVEDALDPRDADGDGGSTLDAADSGLADIGERTPDAGAVDGCVPCTADCRGHACVASDIPGTIERIDATHIYYLADGTLMRRHRCRGIDVVVATGGILHVAFVDDRVFFIENPGTSGAGLFERALDGSPKVQLAALATHGTATGLLAADGLHVYFHVLDPNEPFWPRSTIILRLSRGDGTVEEFYRVLLSGEFESGDDLAELSLNGDDVFLRHGGYRGPGCDFIEVSKMRTHTPYWLTIPHDPYRWSTTCHDTALTSDALYVFEGRYGDLVTAVDHVIGQIDLGTSGWTEIEHATFDRDCMEGTCDALGRAIGADERELFYWKSVYRWVHAPPPGAFDLPRELFTTQWHLMSRSTGNRSTTVRSAVRSAERPGFEWIDLGVTRPRVLGLDDAWIYIDGTFGGVCAVDRARPFCEDQCAIDDTYCEPVYECVYSDSRAEVCVAEKQFYCTDLDGYGCLSWSWSWASPADGIPCGP